MPISLSQYVDINSVVGGNPNVPLRSLTPLIITGNPLVPTGVKLDFTSAAQVGTYFGTASEEYARAEMAFGWTSKTGLKIPLMSFWFWNNDAATASLIFGKPATYALSQFTSITTGDFTLTLGGFTHHLTAINLSSAGSLAAVAADIQAAIRAYSAGGAAWTAATVTFDATRGCFDLVSGLTGADVVSITAGTTTDLAGPLGWLTGAILSNGSAAQDVPTNLTALNTLNNNFGSFCYTTALAVTLATVTAAATWNNSLNPNVQFLFSIVAVATNMSAWVAALAGLSGWAINLQSPVTGEYPEQMPMVIGGAIDYTVQNSVQNFEFQQNFAITPSVTDDLNYALYTGLLVNFYGQTQSAGQLINFYQQGVMGGGNVNSPSDIGVYFNEMWLKDASSAAIMNLLLALPQVAANAGGRSQILSTLQSIINQALFNGTISVGKPLNNTQIEYITEISGDPLAWHQVQSDGYWVNAVIQSYVQSGITKYKVVYTLIYSKDDVIRLVQGTDILI